MTVAASAYARAADILKDAQTITVVGHLRPDADAVGSVTALSAALQSLGKSVTPLVGQPTPIPEYLLSIPGAQQVAPAEKLPEGQDLIVTVDCGSLERTGSLAADIGAAAERVLVIDHHASNEGFGAHNLIAPAESTTSMLRELIAELGVELNRDIAHSLYAGLLTDTGSFRWGTPAMHTLAGELMGYGINTRQIAADLIDSSTASDLKMIGRVLAGIQLRQAGTHTAAILLADLEDIDGHSESSVESLVDFVHALHGSDIGVVFKEKSRGTWAVSLRSSTMDVSQVAVTLGGGGHVPAAGYTAHGPREQVVAELLSLLSTLP